MKNTIFVVLAIVSALIACYYLCRQPGASYVKPTELNQQINAPAQGLNTHWIFEGSEATVTRAGDDCCRKGT